MSAKFPLIAFVHTRWYPAWAVNFITEGGKPNSCQTCDKVKGVPSAHYVRRGYAATANPCIPARELNDIGPFDTCRYSGGDADFCRRAVIGGYQDVAGSLGALVRR